MYDAWNLLLTQFLLQRLGHKNIPYTGVKWAQRWNEKILFLEVVFSGTVKGSSTS